ncbi:Phosphorylase kinase, gamma catalytic subunit [Parasponia andersonii]|uniref:non-specific serine/threonine protein kinase n=1 Tax=Parasponia andersonii TaxID=3476 RepID=A0A2P5CM60_PARAD|nr:Phosphorylase kinase, gamma catalytic subunit [Parasponia andersonii]
MVTASARRIVGNETDKIALLTIKAQIMEDPSRFTSSWNESINFCQWRGVPCSHRHQRVIQLSLGSQSLKGYIPPCIGNHSFLRSIDASNNTFQGEVPHEIGCLFSCSNLRVLQLSQNNFTGRIPVELGLISELEELDLRRNNLEGSIPPHLGNLSSLQKLAIKTNRLEGPVLASLGQLKILTILGIGDNMLSCRIPESISNLSFLNFFVASDNTLQGSLPRNIGLTLSYIERIRENQFSGPIPISFSNASNLEEFDISDNKFSGGIPAIFGNMKNIIWLAMDHIDLGSGETSDMIFFPSLTNCCNLRVSLGNPSLLWQSYAIEQDLLYENNLEGGIPSSFGNCKNLLLLKLDHNNLNEVGHLKSLVELDVSQNHLSGEIPSSLGDCTSLRWLYMDHDNFRDIEQLDLSHNNLSGHIPKDFAKLVFLSKLDLSFNYLKGEVPTTGAFSNISVISIVGNDKDFGGIPHYIWQHALGKSLQKDPFLNVSYGSFGLGSLGSVYKGVLEPHQTSIAVKVFNLSQRGTSKSFMAECQTLRNIRHRNLVKIITACLSLDYQGKEFRALVYEYKPNGGLENWLHPLPHAIIEDKKCLTLSQRLNMVIDIVSALDYLHNHSDSRIIHCDLKRGNILLDQDMTAHVVDLIHQNHTSSVGIKETIGHAAPEYGMGSKASTDGDVYSFGILLVEIFTGKRPTDSEFRDGENLNQFVKMSLPERVAEIVDHGLAQEKKEEEASSSNRSVEARREKIHKCLISILRIGVMCSNESPEERMKIGEVLKELLAIKNMLLEDRRYKNAETQWRSLILS